MNKKSIVLGLAVLFAGFCAGGLAFMPGAAWCQTLEGSELTVKVEVAPDLLVLLEANTGQILAVVKASGRNDIEKAGKRVACPKQ